jgi:hypothetical protein
MTASLTARALGISVVLVTVLTGGRLPAALVAQSGSAADVASKMTGHWKLNQDLSPGLTTPGRGRTGGAARGALFAVAAPAFQRGGRGGGGGGGGGAGGAAAGGSGADSPLMSEEVAAQAALSTVQQVPTELEIAASTQSVEFIEPRGRSVFKVDGKNTTVEVPGGSIKVKSRWDRGSLRQEFSSAQRTLKRSWSIDEQNHLVLTQHVESISLMTKDARAVFDRQ